MLKLRALILGTTIFCLPAYVLAFQPLFDTWVTYGYGWKVAVSSITISDLDNDGDQDLAAVAGDYNTIYPPSESVTVFKNKGDGTFADRAVYVSLGARAIFASDFDLDGYTDLVVTNPGADIYGSAEFGYDSTITILKNNGDGSFITVANYSSGSGPASVFVSELDGDGYPDLAIANFHSHTLSIFKNNGDGTFGNRVDYSTGLQPISVYASDLDGDGDQDLAVTNENSNTVSIFKNNGDATLAPKIDYGTSSRPRSVIASDLEGDGDQDLTVANLGSGLVSLLKNNGDGTFAPKTDLWTLGSPFSVFFSDLDGDGDRELVDTYGGGSFVGPAPNLTILKNQGYGLFSERFDYLTSGAISGTAADLDKDGDQDLVTRGGGVVSVLYNKGSGIFPKSQQYRITGLLTFVSDVDNDGDQDLVTSATGANSIHVLKNDGFGNFAAGIEYPCTSPSRVYGADLDQDGDQDLLTSGGYNSISVLMNNGDGTFAGNVDYQTPSYTVLIQTADLDGDFDLDLAVKSLKAVSIFKNNGDGTFATRVDYSTANALNNFFLSDLDGDNDPDLVLVNYVGNHISVLKNNGDGSFSDQIDYLTGESPGILLVTDFSNDLRQDLVVAHKGYGNPAPDSTFSIFINNGDGTFAGKTDYVVSLPPSQILAPDIDKDGDFDLVVVSQGGIFSTFKNTGNGTFAEKVIYPDKTNGLILADFNVDGDPDLVTVPISSPHPHLPAFTFLENDGAGTFIPSGNYGKIGDYILTSDIDNDADNDLLIQNDATLTILKNTSNTICSSKPGDPNGDGKYNLADIVNEVNLVFKGATKPIPICRADANADGKSNLTDIIYLVNTIFKGGPNPLAFGVCCL